MTKVKEEVRNHFQNQFKESSFGHPNVDRATLRELTQEQRTVISAPFSIEEIKDVIWSCDENKCPELDGFNMKFYRDYWYTIKQDLCDVVHEIFNDAKLLAATTSFLALILKMLNPQGLTEY